MARNSRTEDEQPSAPLWLVTFSDLMTLLLTFFVLLLSLSTLDNRKLKIAIVFDYGAFRFEVWLSGANRKIQSEYWRLIKESGWDKYELSSDPAREDYVIGQVLVGEPDFSDLDVLTSRIEQGTLEFIEEVEVALSGLDS